MIGWESPVNVFSYDISNSIKENVDGAIIVEIERQLGVEINKDELIKAMNYDRDQYNKGYQDGLKSNALRWIPCKERLPESDDYGTVLVTGKMKYASEKEYEYFTDCAFVNQINGTPDNFNPFDFETWNDWHEGQDEYYILAWMPLPEPYKEEGEEN